MTMVGYSDGFTPSKHADVSVRDYLALNKDLINQTNNPTCFPILCSKYNFVKQIDCAVFDEQNRLRTNPKAWLRKLVAFKYDP